MDRAAGAETIERVFGPFWFCRRVVGVEEAVALFDFGGILEVNFVWDPWIHNHGLYIIHP